MKTVALRNKVQSSPGDSVRLLGHREDAADPVQPGHDKPTNQQLIQIFKGLCTLADQTKYVCLKTQYHTNISISHRHGAN